MNVVSTIEEQVRKKSLHVNVAVPDPQFDLVCLSHLRWDFVYQRPQHLISRFARQRRVYFVEEPTFDEGPMRLDVSRREDGLRVVVPRLPQGMSGAEVDQAQRHLLDKLFADEQINQYALWYYTPMALAFSEHLTQQATEYDFIDELSALKLATPKLHEREAELFRRADLVFTGGQSLYEAKRGQHPHVYAFPSSVDVPHFAQALQITNEPADQREIGHPRLGYFGVIDERMDIELLAGIAALRPDWQMVMIGPTAKIDPASLPHPANIHYLGGKSYAELPAYIAGWDVAMMTFARNESTRFISPTKTPEYLAAGKPVVSTSIRDVVRPYGEMGLVRIADSAEEFVAAAEAAMREDAAVRQRRADDFLAHMSWDNTWGRMNALIEAVVSARLGSRVAAQPIDALVSTR